MLNILTVFIDHVHYRQPGDNHFVQLSRNESTRTLQDLSFYTKGVL
jgi:hypothetical protein